MIFDLEPFFWPSLLIQLLFTQPSVSHVCQWIPLILTLAWASYQDSAPPMSTLMPAHCWHLPVPVLNSAYHLVRHCLSVTGPGLWPDSTCILVHYQHSQVPVTSFCTLVLVPFYHPSFHKCIDWYCASCHSLSQALHTSMWNLDT